MIYYIIGGLILWFGCGTIASGICYATSVKGFPDHSLTKRDYQIARAVFYLGPLGLAATFLAEFFVGAIITGQRRCIWMPPWDAFKRNHAPKDAGEVEV